MNSYLFEMYCKDRIPFAFMGYKRVNAETATEAKASLQEAVGDGVNLCQVYINDADPYAR